MLKYLHVQHANQKPCNHQVLAVLAIAMPHNLAESFAQSKYSKNMNEMKSKCQKT